MSAAQSAGEALLVVVSPAALALDGESVRVARDVLGAAFAMKAVMPGNPAELERVLSRRGRRRLVVIGDDQALHQVVQLLYRHAELEAGPVGIIPIGKSHKVALARSLGAESRPVEAARAVSRGAERTLDLLVDEEGGVVLGGLRIPGRGVPGQAPRTGAAERGSARAGQPHAGAASADPQDDPEGESDPHAACSPRANSTASGRGHSGLIGSWCTQLSRTAWTAARTVAAPLLSHGGGTHGQYLRVEADGRLLADLDHPVGLISVWNAASQDGEADGEGTYGGRPRDGGARDDRPRGGGLLSAGTQGTGPYGLPGGPPAPNDGLMEVLVNSPSALGGPFRIRAQRIRVTGGLFTYEADYALSGPVRERTWTVAPGAWRLTVPPSA